MHPREETQGRELWEIPLSTHTHFCPLIPPTSQESRLLSPQHPGRGSPGKGLTLRRRSCFPCFLEGSRTPYGLPGRALDIAGCRRPAGPPQAVA